MSTHTAMTEENQRLMNTRTGVEMGPLWVTTWNVLNRGYENPEYYAKESHAYLHWDQGRRERAREFIKSLTHDVTCLQEVSQSMLVELFADSPSYQCYATVWEPRTEAGAKTEDGLAIVYQTQSVTLLKKFTWRYPSGKHIILACLFERNDCSQKSQFWCVNTHVNWKTREQDLLELQRQLNKHPEFVAAPAPKIVMGDFNAERHENWYKALGQNGLVDALADGEGHAYSYNSGKSAKWIDHVLLHGIKQSSVCEVRYSGMGKSPYTFSDASLPSADIPSDHVPITFALRHL